MLAHQTNLVQCWFPGFHINVGGGTNESVLEPGATPDGLTDMEQLATVSLFWMLDLISPFLSLDEDYLEDLIRRDRIAISSLPVDPVLRKVDWAKSCIWPYPSVRHVSAS
jgi:hypothetical protein